MKKGKMPESKGASENEGKAWGHGQFANMPSEVVMDSYPTNVEAFKHHVINDTMERLDQDSVQERRGNRKNLERGMY